MKHCLCCGYKTLNSFMHDICEVCWWQDDPHCWDDLDCDGGANEISLRQARANFLSFGACDEVMKDSVRQPTEEEKKEKITFLE